MELVVSKGPSMELVNGLEMQRLKKWRLPSISEKTITRLKVQLCSMKPSTPLSWSLVTLVFQFLKIRRLLVAMPSHTSLGFIKTEFLKIPLPMKSSRLSWWVSRATAFLLENCQGATPLSKNCMSWDWNLQKKISNHCLPSSNLWQIRNTRSQTLISAPLLPVQQWKIQKASILMIFALQRTKMKASLQQSAWKMKMVKFLNTLPKVKVQWKRSLTLLINSSTKKFVWLLIALMRWQMGLMPKHVYWLLLRMKRQIPSLTLLV